MVMRHRIICTLAHVDAGKTTLSESLLYQAGMLKARGRVDHGNAFLDYDNQEKKRGITIYAKQAILTVDDLEITLIDTPGHVDFSAEMERTLSVLDYAILVLSGVDGVQPHTETIWKLLQHYQVPTFLFVNKMDIAYRNQEEIMQEICEKLDTHCVNFSDPATMMENIAMCEEQLLDAYVKDQHLDDDLIQSAISKRSVYPCYFGSALKQEGIDTLLHGFIRFGKEKEYPSDFGARVFKITRDGNGNRLAHLKVTGGCLKAKTRLGEMDKIDQLRKYSGVKFQTVQEVSAGDVVAVTGLQSMQAGEGLGFEAHASMPMLSAFMCYCILPPKGCDTFTLMKYLRLLCEEDPTLHVSYHKQNDQVQVQVMGEIQLEILRSILLERFQIEVSFDEGHVKYKETIRTCVEGVGHYEPLQHYAEVHLLLEPTEPGTGLQFASSCSQDELEGQYQRLILSHLQEQAHPGVLTGSPITDMKITILGGRAHKKHTEGGDFREATYRAVRQGLKMASSILLEPYYSYRLTLPASFLSKAMYDVERMHGSCQVTQLENDMCMLTGSAPVKQMQNYAQQVRSFTKGTGSFFCTLKGYEPCVDAQDVIAQLKYDSERDMEHPTGSIFCSQGAGYYVKWDEVYAHMHCNLFWKPPVHTNDTMHVHKKISIDEKELERVVSRIHGPQKPRSKPKKMEIEKSALVEIKKPEKVYLLVDGYNMIFSWKELKELAKTNLEAARKRLIDALCNYQGYKQYEIILVFDAYKVNGNPGEIRKQDTIYIVYTKAKQTADMYIESVAHTMASQCRVIVATSDGMEQLIVMGEGAERMSARELERDLHYVHQYELSQYREKSPQYRNHALEDIRKLNE